MATFQVFAGAQRIGSSALELGDRAVGVAAGRFIPAPAYAQVQAAVIATQHGSQLALGLRVVAPDGRPLALDGNVQIVDYSAELGSDGLEVHVIGIDPDQYDDWPATQATAFAPTQALDEKSGD
ncbi:hypothetical protein [Variovorax sp. YR752]|uniref:hypothetical protein n=1 Tax=Variovorax sp. YR752 TaxID=1884383 RepID=UPI0031377E26